MRIASGGPAYGRQVPSADPQATNAFARRSSTSSATTKGSSLRPCMAPSTAAATTDRPASWCPRRIRSTRFRCERMADREARAPRDLGVRSASGSSDASIPPILTDQTTAPVEGSATQGPRRQGVIPTSGGPVPVRPRKAISSRSTGSGEAPVFRPGDDDVDADGEQVIETLRVGKPRRDRAAPRRCDGSPGKPFTARRTPVALRNPVRP